MENKAEFTKTVTGACHFCGQAAMITLSEDEWLEKIRNTGMSGNDIADILAQEECSCEMGEEWRRDCQMIKEQQMKGLPTEEEYEEVDSKLAKLFARELKRQVDSGKFAQVMGQEA